MVSRPDSSQSGRLRHSSGSLVDFQGRRTALFLLNVRLRVKSERFATSGLLVAVAIADMVGETKLAILVNFSL
jgi:hypothetical protein